MKQLGRVGAMHKHGLAKNFIFQLTYQAMMMLLPLVLSPFLTRTLQEEALGIYSYVNSIAYYFYLFANLGIAKYGQRLISQNVYSERELCKSFWSLFILHSITSLTSILVFAVLTTFFVSDNKLIFYLHILYLCFALVDISWLFYGLEDFKNVVLRNAVVKIIECILIFSFVRKPNDLWKYTVIVNGGYLVGAASLWPIVLKKYRHIKIQQSDIIIHIKPLLTFSIATVAVSMYTIFDKTLLGIMTTKENVAFYEYSYKIIMIPIVISSVIGTVMFPRACRLANEGDIDGQKRYFSYSVLLSTSLSIGSIFGIIGISELLAVEYYGESFRICGKVMLALSPMIYIGSMGDIIRTQYLIPAGMDREYVKCTIYNALINIVISISLIPFLGIFGAVIGTTTAEIFGLIYQTSKCRRMISIKDIFSPVIPFSIIGIGMLIIIKCTDVFLKEDLLGLIIRVLIGASTYALACTVYLISTNNPLYLHIRKKLCSERKPRE